MSTIAWLLLIAALLPIVATGIAKAGDKSFDHNNPRAWMTTLSGYRARASAAQANIFEGLPFFFAAVLFAVFNQVDLQSLRNLMLLWIGLRLAYIACYIANKGMLRSIVWGGCLAVNIVILFTTV